MLKKFSVFLATAVLSCVVAGCVGPGPEQKLGRGLANMAEFARQGEISRSFEQASVFGSPEQAFTSGIIRGIDKSFVRTFVGVYEVVTFPIPNHPLGDYSGILRSSDPLRPYDPAYPTSYRPNWMADAILSPDNSLGFSGGDVAPMIMGSRFHVFDN